MARRITRGHPTNPPEYGWVVFSEDAYWFATEATDEELLDPDEEIWLDETEAQLEAEKLNRRDRKLRKETHVRGRLGDVERIDADVGGPGEYRYGPAQIFVVAPEGGWWQATVDTEDQSMEVEGRTVESTIEHAVAWVDGIVGNDLYRKVMK